jgi:large subunit ribosomal protein L20
MARVKRGTTKHARHAKILSMAKGYRGRASKSYRIARERVEKGLQYAYRDRRRRKSTFRSLWIARINAAVRERGLVYSDFVQALSAADIRLDRKVLSDMAIAEPAAFDSVVEQARRFIKRKA